MSSQRLHVILAGTGNIGSHAAMLLAHSPHVAAVALIDPGRVDESNLVSQNYGAQDVGRFKAEVTAERIHGFNPAVQVQTITEPLQLVPPGRIRGGDLMATGLDDLPTRCYAGSLARHVGIPLVDGGVRADGNLARVSVYPPSPDAACPECGLSERERAEQDTHYPCDRPGSAVPSGSPAYLGALTAGLVCHQVIKAGAGDADYADSAYEILIDLDRNRCWVSTLRQSPECPSDHGGWAIQSLGRSPDSTTVQQALCLVQSKDAQLRVHGDTFVHRLLCPGCQAVYDTLFLAARLDDAARRCPYCGTSMVLPGFYVTDTLTLGQLTEADRRLPLRAVGLRPRDLFSIETASGVTHFELGG